MHCSPVLWASFLSYFGVSGVTGHVKKYGQKTLPSCSSTRFEEGWVQESRPNRRTEGVEDHPEGASSDRGRS